jgi:DNA processing protein
VTAPDGQRLARAALSYLAEPGDPALGALLAARDPAGVLSAIKAGTLPVLPGEPGDPGRAALARSLARSLQRWRLRLPELPAPAQIAAATAGGTALACPGDPHWPASLDALGTARPCALWLRGHASLAALTRQSIAVVGSRAATGYGAHVAGEIAADLAQRGWSIVSGGAYGIDAAAHRGAMITGGTTIAVLACGTDHPYPAGHAALFTAIAAGGLVISEWPPGTRPGRLRFLVRNRVIAALTQATVIIEAGERSGALNTARHAAELGRHLMAIPGPVTSAQSAGCHRIIRDWGATLVTSTTDILNVLRPIGAPAKEEPAGQQPLWRERDDLDPDTARVLDTFPARAGVGPATLAKSAGVEMNTVIGCIGALTTLGFIERCDQGWRLTRKAR